MQRKIRYPRIERNENPYIEEDLNSHLWAVSYSDFLMTLLCFFILLFSADEQVQNSLILTISKTFQGQSLGNNIDQSSEKKFNSANLEKQLLLNFSQLNVSTSKHKNNLIIYLPEDLFESRQYQLSADNEKLLKDIFKKIDSHKSVVKMYFEGHTDDKPLHRQMSSIVFDNYLLGSLRAATALHMAKSMGFDEKDLFIQTTSSHQRNSRTLSIRLEPKEVPL